MSEVSAEVTELLIRWGEGDTDAHARILALVYPRLRELAAQRLAGERRDHTLQPTDLVHEAYLRLVDQRRAQWQNRAHFLAVAAQMMRRILVDHARRRATLKREAQLVTLDDELPVAADARGVDLLRLDDALARLAELDADQARLVELRYFGGLTTEETAEVLKCSPATVKREWSSARAWLRREVLAAAGEAP